MGDITVLRFHVGQPFPWCIVMLEPPNVICPRPVQGISGGFSQEMWGYDPHAYTLPYISCEL
jgi:hypothetical protein